MYWSLKRRKTVEKNQRAAEEAVIMAQVEYMDMLNMQAAAEKVRERNVKMQKENNFGYKIFGVEP